MSAATRPDVAIIGGGIVGAVAAALLAEGGAKVDLYEREEIASAASGRNSGVIQHPFDEHLIALHEETLLMYARLGQQEVGFELPERPAGLLVLSADGEAIERQSAELRAALPALTPTYVEPGELERLEPTLAPGLAACRVETGYPVRPASATLGLCELARRFGAQIRTGTAARPWVEEGRALGVLADGERERADAVLVAAGPWSKELLEAAGCPSLPIVAVWGVTAEVRLERPPAHPLAELGVAVAAGEVRERPESIFSLITADVVSALGSTFLFDEPEPDRLAPALRERGASFVPELARSRIGAARACPRPQSADGRPYLGPIPGVEGLYVAAGHGPWGISTGPASARLVADVLLGREVLIPPELSAGRRRCPG